LGERVSSYYKETYLTLSLLKGGVLIQREKYAVRYRVAARKNSLLTIIAVNLPRGNQR
jgi:hypothetical protein